MASRTADFNERLTTALTGTPGTPLVFLGNFEVEQQWAHGEHSLPRLSASSANAVVNHMDEFALLLGDGNGHVVLKSRPDSEYLDYLAELGLSLPRIHVPAGQDPQRTVTEDALADPELLRTLAQLADEGCALAPHGVSVVEERLAAETGIPLAGPDAATCKAVNSKVYSRRIADELGLRQPRGWTCETLAELSDALDSARSAIEDSRKVAIKEAFGVSGKGIAMLDSTRRADRIHSMLAKQVQRSGKAGLAFVVEEWVEKSRDINYQFTVARSGEVHFDFVKEALTEGGVHKGHRMPADLTSAQQDELIGVGELLGKRLAADGYFGVVGVDAMVDPDGGLYPVMEINARNNMSTYQVRLQEELLGEKQHAMARHYPLRLGKPLPFAEVRQLLSGLLLTGAGGSGLLVNNFATVNAGFPSGNTAVDGRLYGVLVADSAAELPLLDEEITARLDARRSEWA